VAEVSHGVGIGFVWEIWRDTTNLTSKRGLGMYRASLGAELPYANRTGPLIAGPEALPVGIMTVFNAEGYIYTYTNKNGSGIVVGRAKVANAFEADAYEFLKLDGTWVTGIPSYADAEENYGVQGDVHSDGQGSIMFSNYFEQYMLFTGSYGSAMMFYTSDTLYGPWVGPVSSPLSCCTHLKCSQSAYCPFQFITNFTHVWHAVRPRDYSWVRSECSSILEP
jgi:hypothetical protein